MAWGTVCLLLSNALALAQPQVLRLAVDDLYRGVTAEKLGRYALILFAIALASGVFRYLMRQLVIGISRHIEFDLRNDLFAHLQRLPLSVLPAPPHRRDHVARDQRPRRRAHDARPRHHVPGSTRSSWRSSSLGFMLAISPRLTLYSPPAAARWSRSRCGSSASASTAASRRSRRTSPRISARVQENLAGVRVVRAFAREDHEIEDFAALNRDYLGKNLRADPHCRAVFHPALGLPLGARARCSRSTSAAARSSRAGITLGSSWRSPSTWRC